MCCGYASRPHDRRLEGALFPTGIPIPMTGGGRGDSGVWLGSGELGLGPSVVQMLNNTDGDCCVVRGVRWEVPGPGAVTFDGSGRSSSCGCVIGTTAACDCGVAKSSTAADAGVVGVGDAADVSGAVCTP